MWSIKLKPHGTDTDIDTDIRDRLSCNFVNVYIIVYHVQYTYTCTHAHPQRTSLRGKVRMSDKMRPLQLEDPRLEVGEKVRVSVGVRVGPVEFKL